MASQAVHKHPSGLSAISHAPRWPSAGGSSCPVLHTKGNGSHEHPFCSGTSRGELSMQEAKDGARGPLTWPPPLPWGWHPSGHVATGHRSQQWDSRRTILFLIAQIFPSLFQSRRIFGLNFLQFCTRGNTSSHVGISSTFNSGFNSSYRYIYIYIVHRNKTLFEMEKTLLPFNS